MGSWLSWELVGGMILGQSVLLLSEVRIWTIVLPLGLPVVGMLSSLGEEMVEGAKSFVIHTWLVLLLEVVVAVVAIVVVVLLELGVLIG